MLAGKLYIPKWASADNKLPAVLNLHGYQNDKDVQAPSPSSWPAVALWSWRWTRSATEIPRAASSPPVRRPALHRRPQCGLRVPEDPGSCRRRQPGRDGHSMGAIDALLIGYLNPDHRALNFQCGVAGSPDLKNVLLTQPSTTSSPCSVRMSCWCRR